MKLFLVVAFSFFISQPALSSIKPSIINGTLAKTSEHSQVVALQDDTGGFCSATIVGPKTIITAAHCVPEDSSTEVTFDYLGKNYIVTLTGNPLFGPRSDQDFDIAVGVTNKEIKRAKPMNIGGTAKKGDDLELVGFGCHEAYPSKTWDDQKRKATVAVTGFSYPNVITDSPDEVVVCDGDSGGAAFLTVGGKTKLNAVITQSDNISESWSCRLDAEENDEFIKKMAKDKKLKICGITEEC